MSEVKQAEKKAEVKVAARTIALKPYTITELAKVYGVSTRTFKKWVDKKVPEVGPRMGRYYIIPQVKMIFENMKIPTAINIEMQTHKPEVDLA